MNYGRKITKITKKDSRSAFDLRHWGLKSLHIETYFLSLRYVPT